MAKRFLLDAPEEHWENFLDQTENLEVENKIILITRVFSGISPTLLEGGKYFATTFFV